MLLPEWVFGGALKIWFEGVSFHKVECALDALGYCRTLKLRIWAAEKVHE